MAQAVDVLREIEAIPLEELDYTKAKGKATEILHNGRLRLEAKIECYETIINQYLNLYTNLGIYRIFRTYADDFNAEGIEKLAILLINLDNRLGEHRKNLSRENALLLVNNYVLSFNNFLLELGDIGDKEAIFVDIMERWKPDYNDSINKIEKFYSHFFSLYLKGGKAMRYIVMLMNSMIEDESQKLDISLLGKDSDFDFNMVLNPYLPNKLFNDLYLIIKQNIYFIFETRLSLRFFNETNNRNLLEDLNIFFPSVETDRRLISFNLEGNKVPNKYENNLFGQVIFVNSIRGKNLDFELIRLATNHFLRLYGNNLNIVGELIDISLIRDEVDGKINNEIFRDYEHSLRLVTIDRKIIGDINPDFLRGFEPIKCYAIDTIIDDLVLTIKESIERGDVSKVEKRQKRLHFFEQLLCFNQIAINFTGLTMDEFLSKLGDKCLQIFESSKICQGILNEENKRLLLTKVIGKTYDDSLDILFILVKEIFKSYGVYNGIMVSEENNIVEVPLTFNTFNQQIQPTYFNWLDNKKNELRRIMNNGIVNREFIENLLCNLIFNLIYLSASFNDQFMHICLCWYYSDLINNLDKFFDNRNDYIDYDEILKLENELNSKINDLYNERNLKHNVPFIQANSVEIISRLYQYLLETKRKYELPQFILNIRGGMGFILQILSREVNIYDFIIKGENQEYSRLLYTNDIDFELYLNNYNPLQKNLLLLEIKKFMIEMVEYFNRMDPSLSYNPVSVDFSGHTLLQIISDFRSPEESFGDVLNFKFGNVNFALGYAQHPIEINLYNTSIDEKIKTTTHIDSREGCYLSVSNPINLIQDFDRVLRENVHELRKEKYYRRIIFLTNNKMKLSDFTIYEMLGIEEPDSGIRESIRNILVGDDFEEQLERPVSVSDDVIEEPIFHYSEVERAEDDEL